MNRVRNSRGGYPLAALFLLTAASGVLMAVSLPLVHALQAEVGVQEVLTVALGGSLVGTLLGCLVGLQHYCWRGLGWGALIGFLVGLLVAPLVLVPAEGFAALLGAALGGTAVLLAIGSLLRLTAGKGEGVKDTC